MLLLLRVAMLVGVFLPPHSRTCLLSAHDPGKELQALLDEGDVGVIGFLCWWSDHVVASKKRASHLHLPPGLVRSRYGSSPARHGVTATLQLGSLGHC